jgi:uncharacterized protein (DUF983 family)
MGRASGATLTIAKPASFFAFTVFAGHSGIGYIAGLPFRWQLLIWLIAVCVLPVALIVSIGIFGAPSQCDSLR